MPWIAIRPVLGLAFACLAWGGAGAHEFWISPERGVLSPGDEIVAELKVGRMLTGEPYPYLSNRFEAFVIAGGDDGAAPVPGLDGDLPAVTGLPARPGLNILALATIAFRATYDDWALFQQFLDEEGHEEKAELHRARGLPATGFSERYIRFSKALVQAGPVRPGDADRAVGLPVELIADGNPYADGASALAVTLVADGAAVAARRINVFHRGAGETTRAAYTTDAVGRATIALSGPGEYLVSAVLLDPVDDDPVFWSSRWAALSFRLP